MIATKGASEGKVVSLYDYTFPDPLPELLLSRPEFLSIAADYQGRFLLFLLLVLFRHPSKPSI